MPPLEPLYCWPAAASVSVVVVEGTPLPSSVAASPDFHICGSIGPDPQGPGEGATQE